MSLLAELARQVRADMEHDTRAANAAVLPPHDPGSGESTLDDGVLSDAVLRAAAVPDRSRTDSDYVHVSHLVGGCPRAFVLARLSGITTASVNRPSLDLLYDLGKATQAYVTRGLLASLGREAMVGKWTCRRQCAAGRVEGYYDDHIRCVTCGDKIDQYHELTLYDETRRLTGNPDLIVRRGQLVYPVEVKSVTNDAFADIVRTRTARADDAMQVMMYHHLLGISDYPVGDKGIVLYVRRMPSSGHSPYHEKHVYADDTWVREVVPTALAVAERVRDALDGGALPPRPCADIEQRMARQCPHAGECFSRRD